MSRHGILARRSAAALLAFALASPASAAAQRRVGLLVVAHGADSAWNAGVLATVTQVRWAGPVGTAFLMGASADSSGWDSATARLVRAGATELVVVPLMVSSFGAHVRQIQHYAGYPVPLPADLGEHARHVAATPVPARVTAALDDAPELGAIMADRWRLLAPERRARPVLFVGHGPTSEADAARWVENLARIGDSLRAAGHRAEFRVALLRDDAPRAVKAAALGAMRDSLLALATRSGDSVTVMPVLVSSGPIGRRDIPAYLEGLPADVTQLVLAPHPALARWIERVALERPER